MVSLVFLYLTTIIYFEPYIHDNDQAGFHMALEPHWPRVYCRLQRSELINSPQLSLSLPWYKSTPGLCNSLLATLMFAFQV